MSAGRTACPRAPRGAGRLRMKRAKIADRGTTGAHPAPVAERLRARRCRHCRMRFAVASATWRARSAALEVIEHEQPDRRGQVALLALAVDLADELGERHVALARDLLHAVPERLLEAHAGLVACDPDRAFDDGRLHDASPPSSRC